MVSGVGQEQAGLSIHRCRPGSATVGGLADDDEAVFTTRADDIQSTLMHEQARPPLPPEFGQHCPSRASVSRTEDAGPVAGTARPEEIVRGDVGPVWQNRQAWRADVLLGLGRTMFDDHARRLRPFGLGRELLR